MMPIDTSQYSPAIWAEVAKRLPGADRVLQSQAIGFTPMEGQPFYNMGAGTKPAAKSRVQSAQQQQGFNPNDPNQVSALDNFKKQYKALTGREFADQDFKISELEKLPNELLVLLPNSVLSQLTVPRLEQFDNASLKSIIADHPEILMSISADRLAGTGAWAAENVGFKVGFSGEDLQAFIAKLPPGHASIAGLQDALAKAAGSAGGGGTGGGGTGGGGGTDTDLAATLEREKWWAQIANEPGNFYNYAFRSRGMEPFGGARPEFGQPGYGPPGPNGGTPGQGGSGNYPNTGGKAPVTMAPGLGPKIAAMPGSGSTLGAGGGSAQPTIMPKFFGPDITPDQQTAVENWYAQNTANQAGIEAGAQAGMAARKATETAREGSQVWGQFLQRNGEGEWELAWGWGAPGQQATAAMLQQAGAPHLISGLSSPNPRPDIPLGTSAGSATPSQTGQPAPSGGGGTNTGTGTGDPTNPFFGGPPGPTTYDDLVKRLAGAGAGMPPGIANPIAGKDIGPYRSQGGLPFFSPQTLAKMTPSERQLLGVTVNRTGGRAEDYFEKTQQLGRMGGRARSIGYAGGAPAPGR